MTANTMRESVLKILTSYKQEMERYGYYTSNPGVSVDDFEEIADEIVAWQAAQAEQSAELERLRKDAERMQKALSDIAEWTDRYTTPGHPISTIARAAIAKERQS